MKWLTYFGRTSPKILHNQKFNPKPKDSPTSYAGQWSNNPSGNRDNWIAIHISKAIIRIPVDANVFICNNGSITLNSIEDNSPDETVEDKDQNKCGAQMN